MWRLIIKDLRQLLSNKVLIGFCILIVLASVVVVNIGFKEKEKKKDTIVVGIVNEDHGNKYSKMLVDFFGLDQSFSSMVKMKYSNSQNEMAEKFKKGEVQAYIVIPKGFIDDLVHISESKIKVRINQQDSTSAIILGNVLKSYETYVYIVQCNANGMYDAMRKSKISKAECTIKNVDVSYGLIKKVLGKSSYFEYETVDDHGSTSLVDYYIYASIIIFIMYTALYIGIEILKERSYGVLDRYKACGGSCMKFIISKLICAVGVIYSVVCIANILICSVKDREVNNEILTFFLVVTIFCVSFSICASFVIKKIHTYVLTVNMICILSIILGGAIIPTMYLPNNVKIIEKYIPTYNFIEILTSLGKGQLLEDYYGMTFIILAVSVIMLFVSSISYKRSVLND